LKGGTAQDTLKQQDRWQKFSTGELKSLKQALSSANDVSTLDEVGVEILHQMEKAISWRITD